MNVLSALGGPKKGGAVPHRDSVITRVLQVFYCTNVVHFTYLYILPLKWNFGAFSFALSVGLSACLWQKH